MRRHLRSESMRMNSEGVFSLSLSLSSNFSFFFFFYLFEAVVHEIAEGVGHE